MELVQQDRVVKTDGTPVLTRRVFGAVLVSLIAVSGCAKKDRFAKERSEFMSKDLLITQQMPGATNSESMDGVLRARGSGPFRGAVTARVLEFSYRLPGDTKMNTVLDYYVDLLAKQGHKNIIVGCDEDPSDPGNPQVLVRSARWNGKYGYIFRAYL
jgi:hypothetical protein